MRTRVSNNIAQVIYTRCLYLLSHLSNLVVKYSWYEPEPSFQLSTVNFEPLFFVLFQQWLTGDWLLAVAAATIATDNADADANDARYDDTVLMLPMMMSRTVHLRRNVYVLTDSGNSL